jgi:ribosomal protein S18 acetylase RimI-like enzyme
MATEVMIREIRDEDIEQVIGMWHASGITRPWNDPPADIAFARRGPHSTILVAILADQIVATAMVGEDGHRGWVYYVATDPKHQGTGLGRAIMDAAEAWLAKRGIWKVQLLVRDTNGQAKGFYERLGYRDTGVTCFQKVIEPVRSDG